MGDPRKLTRKYETPKAVWNRERIDEERKLITEYGLRNMKEVWIAQKEVRRIRREARSLLALGEKGNEVAAKIISKCLRLGFVKDGATLDNLLALSVRDVLERRLQTRILKRGLAKSIKQARQLAIHGFISVNGKKMNTPGYIVPISEDQSITYYKPIDLNAPVMVQKSARKEEAVKEEVANVEKAETPEVAAPAVA